MKLNFPFKNLATDNLLDFLNKDKVKDFILLKQNKYEEEHPFGENLFKTTINHFKDYLPNFENEILQVIYTTNQSTIDSYFLGLINTISYVKEQFSLANVKRCIENWNNEELKSFEKQVEKDSGFYFANENRKMKHLEEYETEEYGGLISLPYYKGNAKKIKMINYNFFCIEKQPDLIDESYCESYQLFLVELAEEYFDIASKYITSYYNGDIKSKLEKTTFVKPVVYVEGELDITYIKKAAELLKQNELMEKVDFRQRGGYPNLDKIWKAYKDDNWETVPQKRLLLYDCDTNKQNEERGIVYKRTIKTITENIIPKGIENLFPNSIIRKAMQANNAFVDIKIVIRTERGKTMQEIFYSINEAEKKNICQWICENGKAVDFANFQSVFELIGLIV